MASKNGVIKASILLKILIKNPPYQTHPSNTRSFCLVGGQISNHTAKWMQDTSKKSPMELINEVPPIKVEGRIVACEGAYFGYPKKKWEELVVYTSLLDITDMTPSIASAIQKREEKQKVHQFLIGLQLVVSDVPSLADQMSFAANSRSQVQSRDSRSTPLSGGNLRRTGPYCDHCKQDGHYMHTCFQLHPELRPKKEYGKSGGNKPRTTTISKVS
ncbi:hypothetical protein GIB67_028180 [Kingdonia uniflora]|uniref:Uncharacterized protein n=1 Tax=Kingdonia uniflora TaxID=39325 RepID=A0A7J7KZR2_9MAGN|nr:hypothetical protein GIB67_028180 [Kingdonia uniflora]